MRYSASQTTKKHEKILKEAARLFRERGFDGAGVAEIMKAAGLTHGAFYAHFASKEALEAEAVERAFVQSDNRIYALTANTRDPKRVFLDNYLSAAHLDHPGSGCVIAALGP
jgi:TetR/AcrR family transcriptional regulator, transcriptional repressor for nem operon